MSVIDNPGDVRIDLGVAVYVLKPDFERARALSRFADGGFMGLARDINSTVIDAWELTIATGAKLPDAKAVDKMAKELFDHGYTVEIRQKLMEYIECCANGGRPRKDDDEAEEAGGGETSSGNPQSP